MSSGWLCVASYADRALAEATVLCLEENRMAAYVSRNDLVPGFGTEFSVLVPYASSTRASLVLQRSLLDFLALTSLLKTLDSPICELRRES